jgi:hypothetical protein
VPQADSRTAAINSFTYRSSAGEMRVADYVRSGVRATFEMPQYPGGKFEATLVTTLKSMNATSRSVLSCGPTILTVSSLAVLIAESIFQIPFNPTWYACRPQH